MSEVNQASKDAIMKTLAIFGFIAAIIFAVWLAVKIVGIIPGAFSSLASIADGVYNSRPHNEMTVATSKSVVNADEAFTISWTEMNRPGVFTFTYACTDGIALDIRKNDSEVIALDCDTPLNVSSETLALDITASSEKRRFTDIDYTLSFVENGQTNALAVEEATFTVVNASIPQSVAIAEETDETTDSAEETSEAETETPAEPETGEVAGESTSEPVESATTVTPAPVAPTVTETPILEIPVSNPNGFADLAVRFLGVGTMDGDNTFTTEATIDNDTRGAFQFEVRNVGTKTSDDWEFEATLTSGNVFESDEQAPLLPNERSIITLGFDAVGDTGTSFFGAEVSGGDDINTANKPWNVNWFHASNFGLTLS